MTYQQLRREMTATKSDFLRGLYFAFPQGVREAAGVFLVDDRGAQMEIRIVSLPPREIAALRLERIEVAIRFSAGTADLQRAMLARMDRAMQRGGG